MPLSSDFTKWGRTENCRCSYEVQHFRENYNLLILMMPFQVNRGETRNILWRKLDLSVSLSLPQEKVVFFPKSCSHISRLVIMGSEAVHHLRHVVSSDMAHCYSVSSILGLHGNRRDQRQATKSSVATQTFVKSILSSHCRFSPTKRGHYPAVLATNNRG